MNTRPASIPLAIAALLLASCAGDPGAATPSAGDRAGSPAAAPTRAGPDTLLELRTWAVEDAGGVVASALSPYLDSSCGVDPETLRVWDRSGFRLLCVPIDELDAITRAGRLLAPVRAERLGATLDWTPAVQGPRLRGELLRTIGDAVLVEDAHVRVLMRAWGEPIVREGAAPDTGVRLELVVQTHDPSAPISLTEIERRFRGQTSTRSSEGALSDRLRLSAVLPRGTALVLVGESPDADWDEATLRAVVEQREPPGRSASEPNTFGPTPPPDSALVAPETDPEGAPESESAEEAVAPDPIPAAPGRRGQSPGPAGPSAPSPRSIGEAVLTSRPPAHMPGNTGDAVRRPLRRALVAIVLPERAPAASGPTP